MVNNTLPTNDGFWQNLGATWTMSCFALFYLLVPLLKKYIKNFRHSLILWFVLFASGEAVMRMRYLDNLLSVGCLHYFVFGIVAYYAVCEGRKKERTFLLLCEMGSVFCFMDGGLYNETFWLMLFGVLLVTSLDITIHNRMLQKVIDILDEYTYDVYLIHPIFLGKNFIPASLVSDNWGQVITLIIGVTITALLIHNLIEKPILKRYAASKK